MLENEIDDLEDDEDTNDIEDEDNDSEGEDLSEVEKNIEILIDEFVIWFRFNLRIVKSTIILFPVTALIIGVLQYCFHNTAVTEFTNKYLPYCYHPENGFLQVIGTSAIFITIYYFLRKLPATACLVWGSILGCLTIYTLLNKTICDFIFGFLCLVVICYLGFKILAWFGNVISSGNDSRTYDNGNVNFDNNKKSFAELDRENRAKEQEYYKKQAAEMQKRHDELEEEKRIKRETIGSAIQRGKYVYVYNLNGDSMFSRCGTLRGYTSHTVSVKWESTILTYDNKGNTIGNKQEY